MRTKEWMSDFRALVVPKCGINPDGTNLVLGRGADTLNARTQLVNQDMNNPLARWVIIGDPDEFRMETIVTHANPWEASICIRAPHDNSPVEIYSTLSISSRGEFYWKAIHQGDGFYALQLTRNSKQNLNVAGDSNYGVGSQIYSYKWNDGQPNELWKFIWLKYDNNGYRELRPDDHEY